MLIKGIDSKDPEVRFYAAEALAYLDESKAARAAGRRPPATSRPSARLPWPRSARWKTSPPSINCASLLDVPSAETRYGAFRALWAMNPNDPLVQGRRPGRPVQLPLAQYHRAGR